MDTDSAPIHRPSRLNPFAFRSDTDSSFVLLILSVLGSSLVFFNMLVSYLPFLHQQVATYTTCGLTFLKVNPANYPDPFTYADALVAASAVYDRCSSSFHIILLVLSAGGIALVLAVATGIYWVFPLWKLRRDKLVPLSSEDAPEVVEYLSNLCHEIGLAAHPHFVWNPLNLTGGALAFGHLRRYYVALSGGLVTQFYTDQPAFRAIVLHELAHLRNADVNKTYFTVAIWYAFVAVVLLPFVVIGLLQSQLALTLDLGLRVLPLTALVYLTRNGVLRTREYYADVRASTWDGADALEHVLKALPHRKGWRASLTVHPDPDERCQVLDDTRRLFRLNCWRTFGVGVAVTIAFLNIQALVGWIGSLTGIRQVDALTLEVLVPAIIFVPVIVGVPGLDTWRATFAKMAGDQASGNPGLLGLSLGIGLILGRFLLLSPQPLLGTTDLKSLLVYELPWDMLLLVALFFFFRWIALGASGWLEIAATRRSPRLIYTAGLIIAGIVLVIWLEHLFSFRDLSNNFLQRFLPVAGAIDNVKTLFLEVTLLQVSTFLAFACLWAFPLAASIWREQSAAIATASWAFLDSSSAQPARSPLQEPLRPLFALIAGLVGGLTYCLFLFFIEIWRHSYAPAPMANNDQFQFWFGLTLLISGAVLQALVAAFVTMQVRRLGVPHGLFAAFSAGCVMTAALAAANSFYGVSIDLSYLAAVLGWMVNGGAVLALLATLLASGLSSWLRHGSIETSPKSAW